MAARKDPVIPWRSRRRTSVTTARCAPPDSPPIVNTGGAPTSPGPFVSMVSRAIAADQVFFHTNATAGGSAFTGLEAGIIVAALLMALGCAWGLSVRLAEYR